MKRYYFNRLKPDYAEKIAAILGDDWERRATFDKNLIPFKGLEMKYYRAPADELYFRSVESGSGLSVLSVYESELAYSVASVPIDFQADFREQFAYKPGEDELVPQVEVLIDFWRTTLKLDLAKPLLMKRVGLGDTMEVQFLGYEIKQNRDGTRFSAYIKLRDLDYNSEFNYHLDNFSPEWSEVIPRQRPVKQMSLF